jgi:Heat induced stress protein YflT domain
MSKVNSIVAKYNTLQQAEWAVDELREAGIDIKSLSIAAKNKYTREQIVGYYSIGDRMMRWGTMGAFWGGLMGLLLGSSLIAIPGLASILAASQLVTWIVAGLEGAVVVGGLGALAACLVGIGIPKGSALKYKAAEKTNHFLLIVHDTPDAAKKVKDMIEGIENIPFGVPGEPVLA